METEMEKPTTMVIFGASGDLTRRKLIPALFSLFLNKKFRFHYTLSDFPGVV